MANRVFKFFRLLKNMKPPGLNLAAINQNLKSPEFRDVVKKRAMQFSVGGVLFSGVFYLNLLSNDVNTEVPEWMWPHYIRKRIQDSYIYLTFSFALNGLSIITLLKADILRNYLLRPGLLSFLLRFSAVIASGFVTQNLAYTDKLMSFKQLSWVVHSCCLGLLAYPCVMLSGKVIRIICFYTLGIVSGFSSAALGAPNDKLLYTGGFVGMGLGFLLTSQLGLLFFKTTFRRFSNFNLMLIYGGVVAFSAFMMYDTTRMIHNVENFAHDCHPSFDPINNALGMYMDAVNIAIHSVNVLVGYHHK